MAKIMADDKSERTPQPNVLDQVVRVVRSLDFLMSDVQAFWAEELQLTVPQWNILSVIADAGGRGLPVKDTAEALRVGAPFIVHQSRPLEEKGFIRRSNSPADKRVVYLSLTPKAKREMERFATSRRAVCSSIKKELGEAATLHTIELMQQLERCLVRCRARLEIEQ